MKKVLLGAHMPTSGGFYRAAIFGKEVGCSAIQIFTKSNRQWHASIITNEDSETFSKAIKDNNIAYVVAHASYLINLAGPELATQKKSVQALEIELSRCAQLKITDLVLHPGAKKDLPEEMALKQVAQNINLALKSSPKTTRILLETMAGQGSTIGNNFEQLATILSHVHDQDRIGICVDTCHIFAAGYDFSTTEKYHQLWHDFNKIIGLNKLGLVHLNDSKKELNSRVDRHDAIGSGKIGQKAFELIMNDEKLINIPKILETPKEDLAMDQKNLKYLVALLKKDNLRFIKDTNLEIYLD